MKLVKSVMGLLIFFNVFFVAEFLYIHNADVITYLNLLWTIVFGIYLAKEFKIL